MIMDFYKILDFVKKTNPDMTIEYNYIIQLSICNIIQLYNTTIVHNV